MAKFFLNFKSKPAEKSVSQNSPSKKIDSIPFIDQFFMRLSLSDQIMFIKQLAILIRAGIPLFSSLRMIKEQSRSKTMTKIMDHVLEDVENGQYLSAALSKFRKIFGELIINVITVGEISGTLSNNLDYLALTLKKKQILQRRLIAASVYPIFLIFTTIIITVMLTVFIFPKIIPVFKSLNYDLPWTTKSLIFINNLVQSHGILIALAIFIFIVVVLFLLKIKKIHFLYDKTLLYTPLTNRAVQMYNTTNICRTIGLLLNSGVTVVRAFQMTANTTTNLVYKKALNKIAEKLTKGENISTYMKNNQKLFPLIMSQMISVGESTGKLVEMFLYLSDIYEEEMDEFTKNLSNTIEPLLLIFMGILVGFIAISIITPIYGITQHITPK